MPNLVTIWSFQYQHQLLILRGRMEAEGIETYVQDELTIQVDPFYSNALGGIKLMVHEADVAKANEILAESGLVIKDEKHRFEFLTAIDEITSRLPFVDSLASDSRLFILIGLIVIAIALVIYFFAT